MRIDPKWGRGSVSSAPKYSLEELAMLLDVPVKRLSAILARDPSRPKADLSNRKRYYDKKEFLSWYKEYLGRTRNLDDSKLSQEKASGTGA